MSDERLRGIGFAGSLREASYNRALLRAAIELAPPDLSLEPHEVHDLPFYHGDVEAAGDPEPVRGLKAAIREADLVLIVTPEYNQGLPAVTKNAVDWGSRPPRPQAWDGKPVAIMGATPGRLGTVSAQRLLRESLSALNARVMPQPRMLVSGSRSLFADGRLEDEATRERLASFLDSAVRWARRFHGGDA